MNAALLAALIKEIGIPELLNFLRELHAKGQVVDDATVLNKLLSDTSYGIRLGEDWLAANPEPQPKGNAA